MIRQPRRSEKLIAKGEEGIKEYADICSHTNNTDLDVNDKVFIRKPKQDKMSTPITPEPLEIKDKKGSIIAAQNAERTRNTSFFRKLTSSVPVKLIPSDEEDQAAPDTEGTQGAESAVEHHQWDEEVKGEPKSLPVLRRTARTRGAPEYLKDYATLNKIFINSLRKQYAEFSYGCFLTDTLPVSFL